MKFIVDKGTLKDLEDIVDFQVMMADESEGTELDRATVLKGVEAGLKDPQKGTYYLTRDENGRAVGSLFLTKEWSDWNNCWYWWIQSVYVRPECRRLGAFTTLYSKVREFARAEGSTCLRLYVDKGNVRAQQCYKKLGMDECHYLMYEEEL